jgi:hypothetical protein
VTECLGRAILRHSAVATVYAAGVRAPPRRLRGRTPSRRTPSNAYSSPEWTHLGRVSKPVCRPLPPVAVSAIAGFLLAVAAGTVIASQLFLVRWVDATAWAAVLMVLLLLAWIGAFVPSRRAARIDPAAALRLEA